MGRNWQWSYTQGRIKRIKAEIAARQNGEPFDANQIPLHSYDGTMQSKFAKGWRSISEVDIRSKLYRHNIYPSACNTPEHTFKSKEI
ncbi:MULTISPECIES: hypothetical protein [unclassified Pseudoalteromonas]|uniref:hypothetical protein n=1 Tax=unclassified Pseudoalteromonas TaxID=194690 RepID=UPI0015743976|nr:MULTISPECIES: hypothetical protein [unclassified Pseudoalteromonas]